MHTSMFFHLPFELRSKDQAMTPSVHHCQQFYQLQFFPDPRPRYRLRESKRVSCLDGRSVPPALSQPCQVLQMFENQWRRNERPGFFSLSQFSSLG